MVCSILRRAVDSIRKHTTLKIQSGFWQQLSSSNTDQDQKLDAYCAKDGYNTTLCMSLRSDADSNQGM